MIENNDELVKIREQIVALVQQHWDATHKALLLSSLGVRLRRLFPNSSFFMQTGLRDFLTTWPIVKVIAHPNSAQKIGAIPLNVPIPTDVGELFYVSDVPRGSHPIFFKPFWRAFHTPVRERRFVVPPSADQGEPQVLEAEPPEGTTAYEILPSDVTSLPAATPLVEKVHAVLEKIGAWLARHGLSESLFVDQGNTRRGAYAAPTIRGEVDTSRNDFLPIARALARLSPSDQARITVPLDVVIRMILQK
jgi:hypothetical protein